MPSPEEKAVWALMELGRSHTIDEIAMIAEVDVRQCSDAVQNSCVAGTWLWKACERRPQGKLSPCSGRSDPLLNRHSGELNSRRRETATGLAHAERSDRAVASQFDHPFSRKEIMDKMDGMATPAD